LTELIRFHEKARKHFLLQNLPKYKKKKARVSHLFFKTNLKKKNLNPDNKRFSTKKRKKEEKKEEKKLLQSYTPRLDSQSIKRNITFSVQPSHTAFVAYTNAG